MQEYGLHLLSFLSLLVGCLKLVIALLDGFGKLIELTHIDIERLLHPSEIILQYANLVNMQTGRDWFFEITLCYTLSLLSQHLQRFDMMTNDETDM